MDAFQLSALFITLAAAFSYINHRFLGLPASIGLMVLGLGASLLVIAVSFVVPGVTERVVVILEAVDFDRALMEGMLGFLLFAGALHVNLDDLLEQKGIIALTATFGLLISTALVGGMLYFTAQALGLDAPFAACLVFGALISPTDPIAVLAILKSLGAPRSLEVKIAGESLFNDGFAVVLFLALVGFASGGAGSAVEPTLSGIARLFAIEALGGLLFGLGIGTAAYLLMRTVDDYQVEVLISLAMVAGGYSLARAIHVSGPLAMVVAGILIGNAGRRFAMSDRTREHLDTFWHLVDEILNAVLFVLIGLEILVIDFHPGWLLAGFAAIPIVLLARFIAVSLPVTALRRFRSFTPHAIKVMTWGGLRGGISVALALSLSGSLGGVNRELYEGLVLVTYVVVAFSIVVQGATMAPLLRRLGLQGSPASQKG
ncbi:MAG: sodium:proton antiporter [Myxococcota bacterium]|nr:sodium:proton antiporter [Myxococcota bacterium]